MSRKNRDDTATENDTPDVETPDTEANRRPDDSNDSEARGPLVVDSGGPPFIPANVTPTPGVPPEALHAPDDPRRELPGGGYHHGAVHQQVDPITGTRSAENDPVLVSNDALLSTNLTREERIVLLEGLGALFTLHGRGQYAGDRPLPEDQLRALGDKLRGV